MDGTMYDTSGVMSGGLGDLLGKTSGVMSGGPGDLLGKSSRLAEVSSDRVQERAKRKRVIHDELTKLLRLQQQRRQPTSQITVRIDAQNKLLQVAQEQKSALVRLFAE